MIFQFLKAVFCKFNKILVGFYKTFDIVVFRYVSVCDQSFYQTTYVNIEAGNDIARKGFIKANFQIFDDVFNKSDYLLRIDDREIVDQVLQREVF